MLYVSRLFLLVLALLWLAPASGSRQPFARAAPELQEPVECLRRVHQLEQAHDWRAELRDPVIHSEDELRRWVERYRPVYDCLSTAVDLARTEPLADLHHLSGLFLSLAGELTEPGSGQGAGSGYLLPFEEVQDPAVLALRDEIGLPPPPGFVFIWFYPEREAMPPGVQAFFASDNVRGVTVLTRYIIVIDQLAGLAGGDRPALRDWLREQRSRTLSHELVHAYVKASLGPERGFALPRWFDEGLAIYLSGSSQPSAVTYFDESGRVINWSTATEDYARYRDQFQYLEQVYGRAGLAERIRRALVENDPALLYRELGAISESELYALADAARVRRSLTRIALFAGIPLVGLLLLAFFKLLLPAAVLLFPGLGRPWRWGRGWSEEDVIWMKTRGSLPGLVRLLAYHDPRRPLEAASVRFTAAGALRELRHPGAAGPLITALSDESSAVRATAALALGDLATAENRAQILAALFPRFEREPAGEARWAIAEAIYRSGSEMALRPLEAAIRRWLRRPESAGSQRAFVDWAAQHQLYGLMIDLYAWLDSAARAEVAECLLRELSPVLLARLQRGCDSGDPYLRELSEVVLGGC